MNMILGFVSELLAKTPEANKQPAKMTRKRSSFWNMECLNGLMLNDQFLVTWTNPHTVATTGSDVS